MGDLFRRMAVVEFQKFFDNHLICAIDTVSVTIQTFTLVSTRVMNFVTRLGRTK